MGCFVVYKLRFLYDNVIADVGLSVDEPSGTIVSN